MLAIAVAVPLSVGMIDNSWVDVYLVTGFAGWLALRWTHRRWAVLCLAGALMVKPTILLALLIPAAWSQRARVDTLVAAGLAVAATLPFALATGIREFLTASLALYLNNGPRQDGLTITSFWYWTFGRSFPIWLSAALAAIAIAVVVSRRPRTYCDVLAVGALVTTISLVFAKWAFYNYFFVSIWLLVLALAGGDRLFDGPSQLQSPPATGAGRPAWIPVRFARHALRPAAPGSDVPRHAQGEPAPTP